jgi:hypothetical protein
MRPSRRAPRRASSSIGRRAFHRGTVSVRLTHSFLPPSRRSAAPRPQSCPLRPTGGRGARGRGAFLAHSDGGGRKGGVGRDFTAPLPCPCGVPPSGSLLSLSSVVPRLGRASGTGRGRPARRQKEGGEGRGGGGWKNEVEHFRPSLHTRPRLRWEGAELGWLLPRCAGRCCS